MGSAITQTNWDIAIGKVIIRNALEEACNIEYKIQNGHFNSGKKTIGVEQESFIIDQSLFTPCDITEFLKYNSVGVRRETSFYCAEYDLCPITEGTSTGLQNLKNILIKKEQAVEHAFQQKYPNTILINHGTHPFLSANEWQETILYGSERTRYNLLENASIRENKNNTIWIENEKTGEAFQDRATNLSSNTRCFATQLHFAFPTFQETLRAYNISVALTGPLMALFANSPYIGGIDSGLGSSRIEMLEQSEQIRYRQALYANSYTQHIKQELKNPSPFPVTNKKDSLRIAYGAEHITSRICLDYDQRTSRIEVRGLDSMYAHTAYEAVIFLLGLFEGMKDTALPTQEEVNYNFTQGRKGSSAIFMWKERKFSYSQMIQLLNTISKHGANKLKIPFIHMNEKNNHADICRKLTEQYINEGIKKKEAIKISLLNMKKKYGAI